MTSPGSGTSREIPLPAEAPAEIAADAIIAHLTGAGFTAYRVGGSVRDRLLGRAVHEVDVATDAPPEIVQRVFPKTFAVGAAFGVVIVHGDEGVDVEVATFRTESGYADGRHPRHVTFSDAPTDATRRDFTVNALFYDPAEQVVIDYVGGLSDLRKGIVRAIGDPSMRFAEDYLRMLRAVRFTASLGFELDPATRGAIPSLADRLRHISAERVLKELSRMLTGPAPHVAFADLADLGLLDYWLPEVAGMRGVTQSPDFHPEGDVWTHTLLLLRKLRGTDRELAWAALLHDVGKPPTLELRDGRERFPNHANVGGEIAGDILRRLHAPRKLTDAVIDMVGNHMTFMHVQQMRRSTLRRLLSRPTFGQELELHRIDCAASNGFTDNYQFLLDRLSEFAAEPVLPPPLINGRDVLAVGIGEGPEIGRVLAEAQEQQLGGNLASREEALEWLRAQVMAK